MATKSLGRVSIVPQGDYDENQVYKRLDLVKGNGKTYLSLKDNNTDVLSDPNSWMLLTESGKFDDLTPEELNTLLQPLNEAKEAANEAAEAANEAAENALTGISGEATEANSPEPIGFHRYIVTTPITTGSAWGIEVTQAELDDNWVFFNVKDGVITKETKPNLAGKSAYELAVDNGFIGTESEWLDSLNGIDFEYEEGKNKYNLLPQSEGGHTISGQGVDNTGAVLTISGWVMAEIPVKENQDYAFRHVGVSTYFPYDAIIVGALSFLDASKNILSTIDMHPLPEAGGLGGRTLTTPAGTAYIRKNVRLSADYDYVANFQLEEGSVTTAWVPYGDGDITSIENKLIADLTARSEIEILRDEVENLPTGDNTIPKHLALLGDSITWNPTGWVSKLMEKVSFLSVTNLAQSGATWSHRAGTVYDISPKDGNITDINVIWNQVNDLIHRVNVAETMSTPDVIVITAGTNDHGGAPLGDAVTAFTPAYPTTGAAANTMLTIAQAIRYSCELILQNFPNCQIILVTPVQMGIADNAHNFEIGQVIKDCGKYLGVPVIDAGAESGIYGEKELATPHDLSPDGIHPVTHGINKLGAYMARQLKNTITV